MPDDARDAVLSGAATWLRLEDYERDYHLEQFDRPLGYATALIDFLREHTVLGDGARCRVLDVGTGAGANLGWMSRAFSGCEFVGVDINEELLALGAPRLAEFSGVRLLKADALDLGSLGPFDLVVSLQLLSWLSEGELGRALAEQMCAARLGVAATALVSQRSADYLIEVCDHGAGKTKPVTILSEQTLAAMASEADWALTRVEPFSLTADLPDEGLARDIFTRRMYDGTNLAFAGDLFLPQCCALFEPTGGSR